MSNRKLKKINVGWVALVLNAILSFPSWSQSPPSVSPSSLRFSSVGTETGGAEKSIRITNKGNQEIQITTVRREGVDREEFSQSNTCGISLAPKASCFVTVRFAPETAGAKQATLVLESTAGSLTVPVVGVAAGPRLNMRPRTVKFSKTNVGSKSPAKFFTIRNSGKGVLRINTLRPTGLQSDEFSFTHDCVGDLAKGVSCRGEVRFTPQGSGSREGGIEILANEGRFVLGLTGTGYSAEPKLSVSPSRKLSFSSQGTEIESAPKRIRVMNRGAAALRVTSLSRSGIDHSVFAQTNTCGGEIAPREECEIMITFTPQEARSHIAALTIRSNAGDLTLELSGKGVGPKLKVSPSRLSFPTTEALTQSAPQELTLTNTGKGVLRLSSLQFDGNDSLDFTVNSDCIAPLAPKESCTLTARFTPRTEGRKETSFTLLASPELPQFNIPLRGQATAALFSVGGIVSGLVEDEFITVSMDTELVQVTSNGSFSFLKRWPKNTRYEIKVEQPPPDKSCSVANATGVLQNSITNITIVCQGFAPPALDTYGQAFRFLTRTTFGPRPDDVEKLLALGSNAYQQWIDQQIAMPMSSHYDMLADVVLKSGHHSSVTQPTRVGNWFEITVYNEDQLRQRVAFALSQIMVVSDEGPAFEMQLGLAHYYDTLAQHAFGNYRDLLEAVTLHPMMGVYLSMIGNRRTEAGTNLRPDENYAREVMQLFSVGLVQLNQDGSIKLDELGKPIPTYDQEVISGFARVFTGWTYGCAHWLEHWHRGECTFETMLHDVPPREALINRREYNQIMPMELYEAYHEPGEKQLLNYPGVRWPGGKLPAGLGGHEDLRQALDNIFYHPNVAPFVGKQLIQKLVTSNPSPAYIGRVAAVFNDDGRGVRGNLEAVIRAILLDSEAIDPTFESRQSGKLKEPLIAMLQLWRAFNAERPDTRFFITQSFCCPVFGDNPLYIFGQKALGSLSVFNFFSPFFAPPGEIARAGLVAPEAQLATEGLYGIQAWYYYVTAFYRTNTKINAPGNIATDVMYINIDQELPLRDSPEQLLDQVAMKLLGHTNLSKSLREGALRMMRKHDANSDDRISEAIYFIATSPQYAYQ